MGEVYLDIYLKLCGCTASEESGKESWVIEPLIKGSIQDGSITQQRRGRNRAGGGESNTADMASNSEDT